MDEASLNDSNVKVAVRVRPMNRREKDLKTKCVVEMDGNQTILNPAAGNMGKGDARSQPKVFAYDYCFWSMDESDTEKFAGQDVVFECLGESLLDNAFQGYNACIFAYGQTGSGKSYTMMGSVDRPGLIPRLCSSLFERSAKEQREGESFTVEVSYMEIYNEKVRDLLDPKGSRAALRVREHSVLGPYVDGLSRLAVASCKDIESLMSEGNKSRTVAATNMNEESSRSHAVFNIILTHTLQDMQTQTSGEKVSKLSLVDLAGSERAAKTGAAGERLKEGSNINKSLTTLGLVISALADQGAGKNKSKFVPYRDSVLTWLLKDSLGGNSRTAMVATVSPAADNYEETLSTLRYADRAKSIVNHAVVNEDPNARIIRELREEVDKLRDQLTEAESMKAPELKDRLEESEKLIQEMTVTWEDKLRKTEAIAQERQRQLESLGISLQSSGIRVMEDKCFLVNLNADPALNELLVYYLKEHTRVGSANSQDIQLCGMAIQAEHCVIDITSQSGVVITPHKNARTLVNGSPVSAPIQLHHGDRILWGNNHFFRINMPKLLSRSSEEEEGVAGATRSDLSTEHLEVDLDTVSQGSSDVSFNYEYAQTEVMMKALGNNDPMQAVLQTLERRHEEEKRSALERQREMYEQELQQLRRRLTPEKQPVGTATTTPPPPHHHHHHHPHQQPAHHRSSEHLGGHGGGGGGGGGGARGQCLRQWSEEREGVLTRGLHRLREQIVRANLLVQEAGFIAEELNKRTEYRVTLQIPAPNLNANKKRDAVLSEPAVQVRRKGKGKQIWALEKMENRLVDMRELYQEWKEYDEDDPVMRSYFKRADPFFDEQENHSLIGVANVFLSCLFHDVKLQYAVPIINQTGEVAGRLHVEVERVSGDVEESEMGGGEENDRAAWREKEREREGEGQDRQLVCTVRVVQATGLPQHLSNFVFCQYHFWAQQEPVFIAPEVDPLTPHTPSTKDPHALVLFDSSKEFSVCVSEDFVEFLSEGAVAIEVYGHKLAHPRRNLALWDLGVIQAKTRTLRERYTHTHTHTHTHCNLALWDLGVIQAKTRTLRERWSEVVRRLELWVRVLELNEGGEFTPVEVTAAKDVRTGGIYQLRQGQSRRVEVEVRSVQDSGTLPLIADSILSVAVGDIVVRQTRPSKGGSEYQGDEELDSYQERDLERLRAHWLAALTQRQEYLDQHLQKLVGKPDKSEDDVERESQLLECRLTLTEERNAVLVPSAGSGIPGAPAEWSPPSGMETHIPVLFLDLSADDFCDHLSPGLAGGLDACLSEEDEEDFFDLQIVKQHEVEVKAEASWDPTVHDCPELRRGGGANQRVYLTVRVVLLLSHPAQMQLVLRKRICVSLSGKQGFAQSFLRKMSQRSTIPGSGVTFEIVSNVPGDSQGPEDREMLVRLAASAAEGAESSEGDSEAAIEKYLRSVLAVENILTLDRLRQDVAVKEQLAAKGKIRRRCLSSPNVNRLSGSRQDLSSLSQDSFIMDPSVFSPLSSRNSGGHHSNSTPEPVKPVAMVPPVPKLLKSLFPRRDDKKDLRPTPPSQQNVPRIIVQTASVDEDLGAAKAVPAASPASPPPMVTAVFSPLDEDTSIPKTAAADVSMATERPVVLATSNQPEVQEPHAPPPSELDTEDSTPSPISDASSGYMSTSISMATLSEAPVSNPDQTTPPTPEFDSEAVSTPSTNQEGQEEGTLRFSPISAVEEDDDDDDVEKDGAGESDDKDEERISLPLLYSPLIMGDQVKLSQTSAHLEEPSGTAEEPFGTAVELSTTPADADTDLTPSLEAEEGLHNGDAQHHAPVDNTANSTSTSTTEPDAAPLTGINETHSPLDAEEISRELEETDGSSVADVASEKAQELSVPEPSLVTAQEPKLLSEVAQELLDPKSTSEVGQEPSPQPSLDAAQEPMLVPEVSSEPEPSNLVVVPDALPDPAQESSCPQLVIDNSSEAAEEKQNPPEPLKNPPIVPEPSGTALGPQEPCPPSSVPEMSSDTAQEPFDPKSSSEVAAQEPSPPTPLAESQPPAAPVEVPPASDSKIPPSAEEPAAAADTRSDVLDVSSTTTKTSQKTEEPSAPAPPAVVSSAKPPPPHKAASSTSVTNPFKIQKIKTSDIKSFKGISEFGGSGGSLPGLTEPLERLEIISDNEEGGGAEGQEGEELERPLPEWLKEGEYVTVGTNKHGTVRYIGPTEFAEGTWVGVELDLPAGKNDGSVNGKHYFHCNPGYGVLVRPDRVTRADGTAKRKRKNKRHSTHLSASTTNLAASNTNLSRSVTNLAAGSASNLSGSASRLSGSGTNLAALTAMAKREGAGAARRGENRKSWNS
ncbi:kinesin-like protein KIF13B [Engraulis encrasicolus]|uniref:kinesin-like protein KIF13B n=1 Tax=Engraulis encrasicolus TaxID=184585 RepID=UPI002FD05BAE